MRKLDFDYMKKQTLKNKIRKLNLDYYYDVLINKCKKCEETGKIIFYPNRMNIAHIFPKRTYKSVEDVLDNHIFLSAELHTKFDNFIDRLDFESLEREFPNSWKKIVCKRVKEILPMISEQKKLKIKFEEYLGLN